MRLLGRTFLDAFPNAILNIHPSLLPAFPGVDAQRQAWTYGTKVAGATVHFVTGELDGGPIVLQRAVPVEDDDTPETLAARILEVGAPDLSRSRGTRAGRRVDDRRTAIPRRAHGAQSVAQPGQRGDGLERQHGDFRRTVDPDRHVNRAHAAADEDRRALPLRDARR